MRRRWTAAMVLALGASVALTGCSDEEPDRPAPSSPPSTTAQPTEISFGVFGSRDEITAYRAMVDAYNAEASTVQVELRHWPTSEAMRDALESGADLPDLYMIDQRDLAGVIDEGLNQPLFDLLEARNISYGDGFAHDSINAFSAEDDLQCMPYSVSPMVVYYNSDLVDFDRMRERELPVPSEELEGWTFEQFRTAAQFASRPARGTRGLALDATLGTLAPFLYSGGGQLFDSDDEPTSLALSDEENQETLTTFLEVARDPRLTLTDRQMKRATPLEWFKRGKLGMLTGYRSLVPELREVPGLHFDVLPIPSIDDAATIGDLTGLCIARDGQLQRAADLLVHAISDEGFATVVGAGHVVPANLSVSRSEAFLQPDQQPAHAGVFNASVEDMEMLPLVREYERLQQVVAPGLDRLLRAPVIDDLAELTAEIDEASRSVLDPDYEPESPSDSPSGSPSTSPSLPPSRSPSPSPSS